MRCPRRHCRPRSATKAGGARCRAPPPSVRASRRQAEKSHRPRSGRTTLVEILPRAIVFVVEIVSVLVEIVVAVLVVVVLVLVLVLIVFVNRFELDGRNTG